MSAKNSSDKNNNNTSADGILPTNNKKTGVYLTDIYATSNNNNSATIHVGDNFTIYATVVNNSPNTIMISSFDSGDATFDRGVTVNIHYPHGPNITGGTPTPFVLYSRHKTTIQFPDNSKESFKATQTGIVHSEITSKYGIQNGSSTVNSITAPFTFYIYK